MFVAEEVKPYGFSINEARSSGKTAYRIGVERSDNPFHSQFLSDEWTKGWDEASASDPYKKRTDHSAPEDQRVNRSKFRGPGRSYVDTGNKEFRNNRNSRTRR